MWLAWLMSYTGRWEEAAALGPRYRRLSESPGYVSAWFAFQFNAALVAGNLEKAREVHRQAAGALPDASNVKVMEAVLAVSEGEHETARKIARDVWEDRRLGGFALLDLARVGLALGEPDSARHFLERGFVRDLAPVAVRLLPAPPVPPRRRALRPAAAGRGPGLAGGGPHAGPRAARSLPRGAARDRDPRRERGPPA